MTSRFLSDWLRKVAAAVAETLLAEDAHDWLAGILPLELGVVFGVGSASGTGAVMHGCLTTQRHCKLGIDP